MRNFKDSRVMFHLLGTIKYDLVNQLQKQIVNLSTFSTAINPRQITVLLCEHDPVVTVGYSGSRSHIRLKAEQLQKQNLTTKWVNRGGGCFLHGEGQLCVYPLVPLSTFSVSTKAITRTLRDAVRSGLEEIDYQTTTYKSNRAVWGRTGAIATVGVGKHEDMSTHGAYINVNPQMKHFGYIDSVTKLPEGQAKQTLSCLLAERRRAVRMSQVRSALIESVGHAFGCEDYHITTGHPELRRMVSTEH